MNSELYDCTLCEKVFESERHLFYHRIAEKDCFLKKKEEARLAEKKANPSEFPPMDAGSIYLFWPAQFILSQKKIYKIGKTRQKGNKRLTQYLKGSIRLFEFICEDPDKAEKELLTIFRDKFIPYTGIGGGNEYFEGNWKEMHKEIYNHLNSII